MSLVLSLSNLDIQSSTDLITSLASFQITSRFIHDTDTKRASSSTSLLSSQQVKPQMNIPALDVTRRGHVYILNAYLSQLFTRLHSHKLKATSKEVCE
jgi:hypothetical protein